jgi:hypothetical protein
VPFSHEADQIGGAAVKETLFFKEGKVLSEGGKYGVCGKPFSRKFSRLRKFSHPGGLQLYVWYAENRLPKPLNVSSLLSLPMQS